MKQSTPVNPYIGQRIRMERKRLGISQEALASDLNISVNYLGEMERGKRVVNLNMAEKFCQYFHMTLDYLYRGTAPETLCEKTSNATDPHRELMQLFELCSDQELRLCLDICRPVLVTWRRALHTARSDDNSKPPKTWFNQKC